MRKLNNTLYVTSPDRYLSLEGETVIVLEQSEENRAVSPAQSAKYRNLWLHRRQPEADVRLCAAALIALSFISPNGRFLASIHGETKGNVLLRRQQVSGRGQ